MKPLNILFALALSLGTITGCTAAPAPAAAQPGAERQTTPPAPRIRQPVASPAQVDSTCRTDADCTVKNVGNCCGAFPACVNVASAVDPAAVQAQCRASGRMSVCGFREISGCQCVQGQCTAKSSGADTLRRPIEPAEPIR